MLDTLTQLAKRSRLERALAAADTVDISFQRSQLPAAAEAAAADSASVEGTGVSRSTSFDSDPMQQQEHACIPFGVPESPTVCCLYRGLHFSDMLLSPTSSGHIHYTL
eukprot:COSAG01_NODE_39855_length_471_cov_0.911290_1_plen_108_part_00